MYFSRIFSPLAFCFWIASIGPGNFVQCLPQPTHVVSSSISNIFSSIRHASLTWLSSNPRYFPNLGGKFPPFGGHRGRQGYAAH